MLKRSLVCLFLGAAITIAIAWVSVVAAPLAGMQWDIRGATCDAPTRCWYYRVRASAIGTQVLAEPTDQQSIDFMLARSELPESDRSPMPPWSVVQRDSAAFDKDVVLQEVRGWPFRCLYCRLMQISVPLDDWVISGGVTTMSQEWFVSGLDQFGIPVTVRAESDATDPRAQALPIRPLMAGFVGNTAIYALGCYVVLFGTTDARRYWRVRRNRCARCGFQLVGANRGRCPECGFTS
jgi:hypothetical protein